MHDTHLHGRHGAGGIDAKATLAARSTCGAAGPRGGSGAAPSSVQRHVHDRAAVGAHDDQAPCAATATARGARCEHGARTAGAAGDVDGAALDVATGRQLDGAATTTTTTARSHVDAARRAAATAAGLVAIARVGIRALIAHDLRGSVCGAERTAGHLWHHPAR